VVRRVGLVTSGAVVVIGAMVAGDGLVEGVIGAGDKVTRVLGVVDKVVVVVVVVAGVAVVDRVVVAFVEATVAAVAGTMINCALSGRRELDVSTSSTSWPRSTKGRMLSPPAPPLPFSGGPRGSALAGNSATALTSSVNFAALSDSMLSLLGVGWTKLVNGFTPPWAGA
jgi:hypothetical protein